MPWWGSKKAKVDKYVVKTMWGEVRGRRKDKRAVFYVRFGSNDLGKAAILRSHIDVEQKPVLGPHSGHTSQQKTRCLCLPLFVRTRAACFRPQGIPYAAPPVGPLRFQKPQDPAPWTGVRCCRGPAPQAVQSFSMSFRPFVPWRLLGDLLTGIVWLMGRDPRANTNIHKPQKVPKHMSEDCLYLDVELPLPLPTRQEGDG
jgi:hypothetical protein